MLSCLWVTLFYISMYPTSLSRMEKTLYVKFIKKFKYLNIIKSFPPLHRGLFETKRGWGGGGRGEENERRTMRRETRRRQAPAFSPLHGPLCATMVTGWHEFVPIQILLIFGGRCNRYFWDIRLKIYLILICSFSSASKIIQARTIFVVRRKLIMWPTIAKGLLVCKVTLARDS